LAQREPLRYRRAAFQSEGRRHLRGGVTAATEQDQPVLPLTVARRMLVLFTVVVASAAFNAATFSVAAVLPQVQGALSATQDEVSWTVTFYILATAVTMPLTGWLVNRFGRGPVQFWSLVGFTGSTVMCGLAQSLEALVVWRLVQGMTGAPLQPLGQSVLLDVFPRRQHGLVISIFGTTNTIGPVVGPTFAGYLAQAYSWRWGFFMIVPVALVATVAARFALRDEPRSGRVSLDWIGFLSLSIAIASIQLVLSRGQRLDWFDSAEIVIEASIAALALYLFIVHSVTSRSPFLSPRLILDRNYAIGIFLIVIFGMLNFTPMVLLPPLLTGPAGYTDSLVGTIVAGRGVGGCIGFLFAGFAGRLDARLSMSIGFGMLLVAGLWLMQIDLNVNHVTLTANAVLQGLAIGLIWVPLTTVTFSTVGRNDMAEATAVYHLLRNLGSSFFISICVAEIVRSTTSNYSRMVEVLSPFNKLLGMPTVVGNWNPESMAGLAGMSREIARQASMIAYLNAFGMFTAACALTLPLILLMRRRPAPPAT
jgi:MFS transporter, DHA2 family, multidrug resistance protein